MKQVKPKIKKRISAKLNRRGLRLLKKKKRRSPRLKLRKIRVKRRGPIRARRKGRLYKRLNKRTLLRKKRIKRLRKKLRLKKKKRHRTKQASLIPQLPPGTDLPQQASTRYIHVPDLLLPEVDYYDSLWNYIDSAGSTAISVVIPTLNAGPEFRQLMQMLTKQKPFRRIEIIVIDSGSIDETIGIAQEYNANLIRIPMEQFSHSFVRNLGADHSTNSDYLLFMTQDALPPSEHWIYQMYAAAITYDATAVSCSEVMKENADLYYRIISWSHYKYLGVLNADKIMQLPEHQTYESLRVNAQLMNNSCLIRKDVFMNYKFRLDYAEDLDLGLRLIKEGHKLAMLGKTRVIHSHNRQAFYYLKRGYVNSLTLRSLFEDFPLLEPLASQELAGQIVKSYGVITALVHKLYGNLYSGCSVTDLLHETLGFIDRAITNGHTPIPIYNHPYVDDRFFSYVASNQGILNVSERYDLLNSVKNFIHVMCEYLQQVHESINPCVLEEVKYCLFKELADRIGSFLASSYVATPEHHRRGLIQMINPISKGVKV